MSYITEEMRLAARAAINEGRDGKTIAQIGDSWWEGAFEAAIPLVRKQAFEEALAFVQEQVPWGGLGGEDDETTIMKGIARQFENWVEEKVRAEVKT